MIGAVWLKLVSVDATVIMEAPPLAPHRDAIRASLGSTLGLPVDSISVKATTNDGMGFIGRGEGAAAIAIVSMETTVGASVLR